MLDILTNLPGGQVGFMFVSMSVIFFLGFFIDFFEIAFIVIPIFKPVAETLGIDLLWYGVVVGANLQTSFLTPPFGFALFTYAVSPSNRLKRRKSIEVRFRLSCYNYWCCY